jgi:dihydropteroate synthase
VLSLRGRQFAPGEFAVMGIVNRTPDSFYDKGATFAFRAALARAHEVIAQGADIVDIGGVKAAPGEHVSSAEEIDRTVEFVAAVRAAHPDVIISVDTWRHEVAAAACEAGADLLNDAWGGHDPEVLEVAAQYRVGVVCTHVGGLTPRTRPHRLHYDDVVADVLAHTLTLAERAVAAGIDPDSVLIDPAHDFGKNTYHSLEITRRLDEMVTTGWPVLVSLSNKDFVGETLGSRLVDQRLIGTLATTSVCAWLGATVFRAHNIRETRQTLDMIASVRGTRPPARAVRGLA